VSAGGTVAASGATGGGAATTGMTAGGTVAGTGATGSGAASMVLPGLERAVSLPLKLLAGVAAGVVAVGGGGLAHVTAATSSFDVINPAQAQLLFQDAWRTSVDAFQTSNFGELLSVYAPNVVATAESLVAESPGNQGKEIHTGLSSAAVYVPHQTSYPATFLAAGTLDIGTGTSKTVEQILAVFARPTANASWKIVHLATAKQVVSGLTVAGDGFASSASVATMKALVIQPMGLPNAYANYLNMALAGSTSGGVAFAPGSWTTDSIASNVTQRSEFGAHQIDANIEVHTVGGTVYSFALRNGSVVADFYVESSSVLRQLNNCATSAIDFPSPGGPYPSGNYSSSRERDLYDLVAIIPPRHGAATTSSGQVSVVAGFRFVESVVTTPCPGH
jgi:hypothetical protein